MTAIGDDTQAERAERAARAAVVAAAEAIAALPMQQWRLMVLSLLAALELRAPDGVFWEQIITNTELDFRHRRAVGKWPGVKM